MHHTRRRLPRLLRDRSGATAIEYGLIVSLIVTVSMIGIRSLGGGNGGKWTNLSERVSAVAPNP